jgi:hypothetical protein
MQTGQPSQTALGAAAHRAVHQTLEGGVIFADPFALQILSDDTRARLPDMANDPAHLPMRLFIAARSRFSEDTMAACVARGVRQIVILGAGLDTFSLRNPHADASASRRPGSRCRLRWSLRPSISSGRAWLRDWPPPAFAPTSRPISSGSASCRI